MRGRALRDVKSGLKLTNFKPMKLTNIFAFLTMAVASLGLMSCDSEKDLIIIEGNLPIKTSTLYMVGDGTPAGWDIGNPVALTPTEEDPLVFTYEGPLYQGEIKLSLITGSWDAPFIRPLTDQSPISSSNLNAEPFQMHAGDPDEKWRVTQEGNYKLVFDLRNWTLTTNYL